MSIDDTVSCNKHEMLMESKEVVNTASSYSGGPRPRISPWKITIAKNLRGSSQFPQANFGITQAATHSVTHFAFYIPQSELVSLKNWRNKYRPKSRRFENGSWGVEWHCALNVTKWNGYWKPTIWAKSHIPPSPTFMKCKVSFVFSQLPVATVNQHSAVELYTDLR